MHYYISVLKNYATFTGRARRSEYWYFVLFSMIATIVAAIIDRMLGTTFSMAIGGESVSLGYGYVYLFYSLAVFLPGLAVTVRRLHDTNKSGWYFLIILIPLAGAIWLLVLLCTDSTFGINKYGPNPKGIGNIDEIDEIGKDMTN
ncbi:MAG: DUF805 domain-containing protein [Ginsengibacter sp.]